MENNELKVNVTYNAGSIRYYATINRGREVLFSFWPSPVDPALWDFDLPEANRYPWFVSPDGFPVEYVKHLIQSIYFIRYGGTDFPEVVFTKEARKILGI